MIRREPPRAAPDLNLANVIARFRDELDAAATAAAENSREPLFRISNVELEVNVILRESATATGGLKLEAVTAEQSEQYGSERVQKIKLQLEPLPAREIDIPPTNGG